jgi:methyltransferase
VLSRALYTGLVALTGVERLVELRVSRRNAARALDRGGREHGRGHFPFMVALHTGLLVGAVAEVWWRGRRFVPALGWPMLAAAVASQGLRWWCIRTLGEQWNTRVVVVPGEPLVTGGPYRWARHPNYVAVVLEGVALPLVHSARWTAAAFTALNIPLLVVRIRCEEAALDDAAGQRPSPAEEGPWTGPRSIGFSGTSPASS